MKIENLKLKFNRGFTLLEILLAISIITILTALSVPIYQSYQVKNDLDITASTVVQNLWRAQTLSQAVDGDTTWGVKIQSGNITLFKGASYAARDTSYDEIFDISINITPSGVGEIVFSKFSGLPSTTGTITLTSSVNESKTITVNTKGTITY